MTEKKLTVKQQKFAKAAAASKSATEAAIMAGYSKKTARSIASENLTKPNIQKAVEEEIDRAAEAAGVNPEYVYRKLKQIIEVNTQLIADGDDDEQTLDKDGKQVWVMVDPLAANQAAKTLGGFLKMGKDKAEEAKDEALMSLAEILRERIGALK